jgi:hypothetical protein
VVLAASRVHLTPLGILIDFWVAIALVLFWMLGWYMLGIGIGIAHPGYRLIRPKPEVFQHLHRDDMHRNGQTVNR